MFSTGTSNLQRPSREPGTTAATGRVPASGMLFKMQPIESYKDKYIF